MIRFEEIPREIRKAWAILLTRARSIFGRAVEEYGEIKHAKVQLSSPSMRNRSD